MKKTPKNQLLTHFGLLENSAFQYHCLACQNLFRIYLYQKKPCTVKNLFRFDPLQILYFLIFYHFVHSVDIKFSLKRI